MPFNIAPADVALDVSTVLAAAGQSATSNVLDLQVSSPNSCAWKSGLIKVSWPNLPENTVAAGITVTMQVAQPSGANSQPAPALPVPGAFGAAVRSQVITIAGVAGGSPAGAAYFNLEFDPYGSNYQFYQFVVAVTAGINTQGETITIQYVPVDDCV